MTSTDSSSKAKKAAAPKPKPSGVPWSQIWTVFFISAAMFAVGVMVGRGSAPVQFDIEALQNELMELRQKVAHQEEIRYQLKSEPSGQAPQLEFYEKLKEPDKSTAQIAEATPQPAAKPPAGPNPEAVAPVRKAEPEPKSETKAPATTPAAAPHKAMLTIQIAAVRDPAAAATIVEKLRQKGYPAYVHRHQPPGKGVWYRVQVGHFAQRPAADVHLEKLKQQGIQGVVVAGG